MLPKIVKKLQEKQHVVFKERHQIQILSDDNCDIFVSGRDSPRNRLFCSILCRRHFAFHLLMFFGCKPSINPPPAPSPTASPATCCFISKRQKDDWFPRAAIIRPEGHTLLKTIICTVKLQICKNAFRKFTIQNPPPP